MVLREIQRAKDVLARNVRVHRAIRQLSQGDLAAAAETNQMTISRIEARKANHEVRSLAERSFAFIKATSFGFVVHFEAEQPKSVSSFHCVETAWRYRRLMRCGK